MKVQVYYEDTDLGGIVYHANYLKYCERARSEIFFKNDMLPTLGGDSGFVVRKIDANFIGTATLGNTLEVSTKVLVMKNSSIVLLQEVSKEGHKIFSMEVLLVYVVHLKPSRIPKAFQDIFAMY